MYQTPIILTAIFVTTTMVVLLLRKMRNEERGHFNVLMSMLAMQQGTMSMITPEVQALMDQAKAATQIGPALDAGFKALTAQVATLQQTVASSTSMTDEEKAAVNQITSDLTNSVNTLKTDIPANVTPTPAPQPAPNAPTGGTTGGV